MWGTSVCVALCMVAWPFLLSTRGVARYWGKGSDSHVLG